MNNRKVKIPSVLPSVSPVNECDIVNVNNRNAPAATIGGVLSRRKTYRNVDETRQDPGRPDGREVRGDQLPAGREHVPGVLSRLEGLSEERRGRRA